MCDPGVLCRLVCFGERLVPYDWGLRLQAALVDTGAPNTVLCMQHTHAITIGKRGSIQDVKFDQDQLRDLGAAVHHVPRGGEVTYHGPGQLTVYPVLNIRELRVGPRRYVDSIEQAMIQTAGAWGIQARGNVPGKTGVWVGERKIGAVGVRFSKGMSTHGVALNVTTDLAWFDRIVPCGQPEARATSLQQELGRPVAIDVVADQLLSHIVRSVPLPSHRHISPEELQRELGDRLEPMPAA